MIKFEHVSKAYIEDDYVISKGDLEIERANFL